MLRLERTCAGSARGGERPRASNRSRSIVPSADSSSVSEATFQSISDQEMAMKKAERRVTKTFLIMEALSKAGYRVDEVDLVQDRRKRPKGN